MYRYLPNEPEIHTFGMFTSQTKMLTIPAEYLPAISRFADGTSSGCADCHQFYNLPTCPADS